MVSTGEALNVSLPFRTAASGVAVRGFGRSPGGPTLWRDGSILEKIDALRTLQAGWDGADAPSPSPLQLQQAAYFAQIVLPDSEAPLPSVGPANDGGVVFEWELGGGRALYCYVRGLIVDVAAFDDQRDFVDLKLPTPAAGVVASVLLTNRAWD